MTIYEQRMAIMAKYTVEDMYNLAKRIKLMIELEELD
jgi:hypothetical protein